MRKIFALILTIMCLALLVGCTSQAASEAAAPEVTYEDGTYRGTFSDKGAMQVGVQFKLEDNVVTSIKFRHLEHAGNNYLKEEDPFFVGLKGQYETALTYLEGKDIRVSLEDLYEPGNIVEGTVDSLSGATIRSNKIISAIRDGLNRGVYSY